MRAAVCAAVVVWQIYESARASLFSSGEGELLRFLILGAALCGLVVSLLKLGVDY
jgi:hypothetical protein